MARVSMAQLEVDDARILRCNCFGGEGVCERHTAQLFDACNAGDFGTLQTLLCTRGEFLDVNAPVRPIEQLRPLMLRSVLIRPQMVELLLSHPNIDVEARDGNGETALHHACRLLSLSFDVVVADAHAFAKSARLLAMRCCDVTVQDGLSLTKDEILDQFFLKPRIFEFLKGKRRPGELTKSAAGVGKLRAAPKPSE